ncbi:MOSC domain-containing protein [Iamia majanohamensis]|uniref:MOSC domain-containing protein n=1 Tax=Iamia majanohamensis TaxID=467976 RepID=A0AAE9Y5H1_9ACTN|nr:MOSC domain-containing protein [Iamia majanohamensis]WCO66777.1 MOSC domain-containing protein [Iamia majanohamensis]
MHVAQIWQHPVKSMVGRTVGTAEVVPTGLVGDRTWAVRDQVRGGIRGAKQLGGLMRLAAVPVDGPGGHVAITLPDGTTVTTVDPGASAAVSAAIDHEVTLEPLAPPEDLDHYRRGEMYHDDLMDDLRATFGREPDEPLPDLSQFPPEVLEFESPPGTYHDVHPLLLLSTSALAALAEALPDSDVDVRRFRPSLVVDTDGAPGHPERDWVGRSLRVGEVELDVVGGCPRCVMVTRAVGTDVPADRRILRHVVSELGQDLGVYATVARPGRIATGDPVTLGG